MKNSKPEKEMTLTEKADKASEAVYQINAKRIYLLEKFGDEIAKREKYRNHQGLDAVHFYLVQKYHWLPSVVKALNWDDLLFLMDDEWQLWVDKNR